MTPPGPWSVSGLLFCGCSQTFWPRNWNHSNPRVQKIKNPLSWYFGFSIVLVFSTLFFSVFQCIFRVFRVLVQPSTSGYNIIFQFFWVLSSEPHTVASGPFQLSFPPGWILSLRHCLQLWVTGGEDCREFFERDVLRKTRMRRLWRTRNPLWRVRLYWSILRILFW